jgi:hypothetical protein
VVTGIGRQIGTPFGEDLCHAVVVGILHRFTDTA